MKMTCNPRGIWSLLLFLFMTTAAATTTIRGVITDKTSKEPLTGATVQVVGTTIGGIADIDGRFEISSLSAGSYTLEIKYVSYQSQTLAAVKVDASQSLELAIELEPENLQLENVVVVAQMKRNTDLAMLTSTKNSLLVQTGVSAQQIARTQDKNASEIIRRVPGISIIEDRFVVVRGLSQRYNNVWVNNAAVPSSEADSRAFSFDIIPSSQLDNIVIIKSPAPELPADFTGGFIKIQTRDVPQTNSFTLQYGTGINTATHFGNFLSNPGSRTDLLGFDGGKRALKNGTMDNRLNNDNAKEVTDFTRNGVTNNWTLKKRHALPDQKLNLSYNRRHETESGQQMALLSALNYSLTSKSITDMENARFGIYNVQQDEADYLYKYSDNQYSTTAALGAMLNFTYAPTNRHTYEFKNIFNQMGQDKYTDREGYRFVSGKYIEQKSEYHYSSRTTYSGQMSGTHRFEREAKLDWNIGYSYANKMQPDRRIINRQENDVPGDLHMGEMQIDQNEIKREFSTLHEHIVTAATNWFQTYEFGAFRPTLKAGLYAEYRSRNYRNRSFNYQWNNDHTLGDFTYGDVINDILLPENYGSDKLYLFEDTDNRDSYSGTNSHFAAFAATNLPLGKLNLYAGVRLESNRMALKSYTSITDYRTKEIVYPSTDLFPSLNMSYNFSEKHLLRLAYGSSVNRAEFREVSPSVYYDFELFSHVKGNKDLKTAYIQNLDLRYEWYPSSGESVSVALFYKNFRNPIEWTYLDAGGSYMYTFENARSANNWGVEVDIIKNLDFLGAKGLTWTFNAALINSRVNFEEGSMEKNRPMQGQSPYLINTGLFYNHVPWGVNVGLLYNRIGKRIVGVGRVDTTEGGTVNNDIPDAYEMPRNMLDLSITKKIGQRVELKLSARDILSEAVTFKQYPRFYDQNNVMHERSQVTKKYNPGSSISLSINVNL